MLEHFRQYIGKPASEIPAPPFTKWLNGSLLRVEKGEIEAEFIVRKEMTNPVGVLHGGIHAAILDDIVGMTVALHGLSNLYVSVNLSVDFLAPAQIGEKVIARSKVVRAGKTIVNAVAELYNESGTLLSRATTNMVNTGLPALNSQQF
ncbi:MAG: PaaI family thioesterase [Cytophagales bacterium]|nr:PaaI family thioesterase [Bernardetiaceae bacterium]MDW8204544.1 PaaI family thioesterase [Cytophagales bacterium]